MNKIFALTFCATVSALISTPTLAEITLTGDSRFRYAHISISQNNNLLTSANTNDHRARIFFTGTNGDTTVFADLRHNNGSSSVGNFYIDTSVGPVGVKGGKFYNTAGLGMRKIMLENNRIELSSSFDNWKIGMNMRAGGETGVGDLFVEGSVGGAKFQIAHNPNTGIANLTTPATGNGSWTDIAVSGSAGNFNYGLEYFMDGSDYENDMIYGEVGMTINTVDFALGYLKNDARYGIHRVDPDGDGNFHPIVFDESSATNYQGGDGEAAFMGSPLINASHTSILEVADLASAVGFRAKTKWRFGHIIAHAIDIDVFPDLAVINAIDVQNAANEEAGAPALTEDEMETLFANAGNGADLSGELVDFSFIFPLSSGATFTIDMGLAKSEEIETRVFGANLSVSF